MGYGGYSYDSHVTMATAASTRSREQIFTQNTTHNLMNPVNVELRESRDSPEHPNSLPVIFALDVTGSMGRIPELLVKQELPNFMLGLQKAGIDDPQLMFMAIGDANCDRAPLQVGQFESTAEDINRWLTWTYLEGGGGGNMGESYEMAMYFAASHTVHDAQEQRGKKGYFFMTGDEPHFDRISKSLFKSFCDKDIPEDMLFGEIAKHLAVKYNSFFIIPDSSRVIHGGVDLREQWNVEGMTVVSLEKVEDMCHVCAGIVALSEGVAFDVEDWARRTAEHVPADQLARVKRTLNKLFITA